MTGRSISTKLQVLAGMVALVFLLAGWSAATTPVHGPHSRLDLWGMRSAGEYIQGLPLQEGTYFVTAAKCAGCHGHDMNGMSMVDSEGNDINVVDDWRSTMMANAARDPFFQAKMEHEGLANPMHKEAIEHSCLKCHAPLAVFEEKMLGNPPFTMANLDTSVMAHDGISCLACHMQNPEAAGNFFSGDLHYDSALVWGPYTDEQINPAIMQYFVGYTPDLGEHILDGRVCAGCHTAINQPFDLEGNPTGTSFYEQTLWQEYKNSVYYGSEQNCRSCHMPRIEDQVTLALDYVYLGGQSPFGKHHLTGGGTFMLKMMKGLIDSLNIPATPEQFDSTIARSVAMHAEAVEMDLQVDVANDTLYVDVALTNITGHKFPGGFPNRRAFVQLLALTPHGDTLFNSGAWDDTYEVVGHDPEYEPHHNVIRQEDQVQIYEFVMGDVNHDVTTTLLHAVHRLKDNRLVPIGFTTEHASYDTAAIAGLALVDPDFNRDAFGDQGTGSDVVHYHVTLTGYEGDMEVKAKLWFQQVPPRWNQSMFAHEGPRINAFRTLFQQADNSPELIVADSLQWIGTGMAQQVNATPLVFPNPTRDGWVHLHAPEAEVITAYDASGRQVQVTTERRGTDWRCRLPEPPGAYHLVLRGPQGMHAVRVVRW